MSTNFIYNRLNEIRVSRKAILNSLLQVSSMGRIHLGSLAPSEGSRKVAHRLGRGNGSGRGKTCGRGHKGQGKYSSGKGPGFEGGQTPLLKTMPKHGFRKLVLYLF
eukprot:Sdes_comp16295_c0_seq1m5650